MFSYLGMEESSKLGGPNGLAGHPHLKTLTLQDNRQGEQDGETRMSDHTIIHNSPIPAEEVPLGISSHSSSRIFAGQRIHRDVVIERTIRKRIYYSRDILRFPFTNEITHFAYIRHGVLLAGGCLADIRRN